VYYLSYLQTMRTRIIADDLPRSAHIRATLNNLPWVRAAERTKFKLATLTFRCRRSSAPRYLSADFIRVVVVVLALLRPMVLSLGHYISSLSALPVAGANLWNDLSDDLTSLQSQFSFRRQFKTFLFHSSYPYAEVYSARQFNCFYGI